MLILKVIAIWITTGAGLLRNGLEYRWRDRRTNLHTRVQRGLIILMIVGAIMASSIVALDDGRLNDQIKDLKIKIESDTSNAIAREKEAAKDRAELKGKVDNLQTHITPFLSIATAKYPNLDPEKALERLAEDVKELRQRTEILDAQTQALAARDFFHPLSPSIKQLVVTNLKQIPQHFPEKKIRVSVNVESGHTGRQKIGQELVAILIEGGLNTSRPSSITTLTSGGVLPAVNFTYNPADRDVANSLAGALKPFLQGTFVGRKDDERKIGEIGIDLYGEPLFGDDGIVTFP